jgi:AsmA protein
LRRILIGLAALVILAIGVVFIAPRFISTDEMWTKALAQVESTTGYRVRVDGPVRVTVFPSLDLVASDVGIAQPAEGGAAEFATARSVKFGLMLGGLLSGKVQFTEMMLVDPVITLPLPKGAGPEPAADGASEPAGTMQQLTLDELHIQNGTVVLPAAPDGAPGKQVTGLDLDATLPHADGPLTFEAAGSYDGDRIKAAGSIGNFAQLLDGAAAPVKLTIEAPDVLPDGATINGTAAYKDDVLTLAQFTAQSGPHALSGNATYSDDILTIADGTFDKTPFAGRAKLADGALTVAVNAAIDGKPVGLTGAVSSFDRFLAGGDAPITLTVAAPDYLAAEATLSGTAAYKDGRFTLPQFTAASGEDTLSGAAAYKDDALSLSGITAKLGARMIAGDAAYKDDAVTLDVTVTEDGKPAKIAGSIAGIDKLLGGAPAPIKLTIDAPDRLPATASVDGAAYYKDDTLILTGFTAVSGPYRLTGNGTYKNDILVLDPITATTGGQTVAGAMTANLAGDVPNITATLTASSSGNAKDANIKDANVEDANIEGAAPEPVGEAQPLQDAPGEKTKTPARAANPIAAPPGSATEIAIAPPAADAPAPAAAAKAPVAAAPRGSGFGWRAEKLGVLALKGVNADVTLTLDQIVHEGIRIGGGAVKATLAGGKLTIDAPGLKAYGGGGSVNLVIDASGPVPAYRLTLALADLDAYPFLRDVAEFTTIEGKAALAAELSASGDNERAMVSSLNGTANFGFTDGALRGLNVANMLRTLTTGILTGWQFKQEAKTVFNKFGANFKIANGQAQTDDLRMTGPLVSIGGAGTVDVPAQRLKFRVNPFMLASVEGSGGKNSMLGFPVPIAVTGPWDNPSIYPDIVGVLENPVAAYQQLDKLGGGLISMPANMLGIDTGEGGLVKKSVAVPTAITKGVVGGIGQVLGIKKKDAPPPQGETVAPPAEGEAAAPAVQQAPAPVAGQTAEPAPAGEAAPPAAGEPPQQPAAEAAPPPKKKGPVNDLMQGMFGN